MTAAAYLILAYLTGAAQAGMLAWAWSVTRPSDHHDEPRDDTMPRWRACRRWVEEVSNGRARESTGSGRLVVVGDSGATLPARCPYCGLSLYSQIGRSWVLSPAGDAHREAVRDAKARRERDADRDDGDG